MKNPFSRLGAIFNRAAGYASMRIHVAMANLWRDNYNPLRGLTISRAVAMLEAGERGAYAELQWTYRFIEMQDATIGALVERRTSAIQQLDWDIKVRDKVPAGKEAVAEKQRAALEAAYERIGNLSAAFEFLEMCAFRGYGHLEKVEGKDGAVERLEPVDQWFWVRDGMYGTWKLNAKSTFGVVAGEEIPRERFIIREVARPINRVALIAFIRKNLSQKDWDAFIETYGVPAVFIVMPENIPSGKEDEYLDLADQVVSDARGTLPGGSDVKTVNPGMSGEVPFKSHLDYQDQQIVMRGTGGLLTMLTQSGSGTLAGGAHSDTFAAIARAEAREISEIFQTQFDKDVLARVTPGEPAWAYFELSANEETDSKSITEDVARLAGAGYQVKADWIAEKTGYEFADAKTEDKKTEDGRQELTTLEPIKTREGIANTRRGEGAETFGEWISDVRRPEWIDALSADLQPLGKALEGAMNAGDAAAVQGALKKLSARMPEFIETPGLEDYLTERFAAWMAGDELIRNSGNKTGAIKGWETRRRNGWQAKPKSAGEKVSRLVDEALADKSGKDAFVDYAEVSDEEAGLLGLEPGFKRSMTANQIRHMKNTHGDPAQEEPRGQIAITDADIKRIPEIIAGSQAAKHEGVLRTGNATIRYFFDDPAGGTTTVLDEVRTGRKKLVPAQMIKFKGSGIRAVPEPKHILRNNREAARWAHDCSRPSTSETVPRPPPQKIYHRPRPFQLQNETDFPTPHPSGRDGRAPLMKPNLLILNRVSGPPADGWYQIEVTGEHPASGNRIQVIDAEALESMVNRFAADKSAAGEHWAGMLVDGDHLSHDHENSTEAFAWMQDLAIRNGQLFGRLDLTDLGEPAIRNKRFKFFSTEYDAEDLQDLGNGRVRPLRLAGLAFTNRPNNKGGQPISNRADNPSGEPTNNTKPTRTMKSIAEKLGLSAEATEADILTAITALQSKVADAETKVAEGAAEEVMNRFGTRIPEAARPHWKAELIRNRETTEKLMDSSFPEKAETTATGKPAIFNRADSKSPAPVEAAEAKTGAEADKKAAAIRNRADVISREKKIPFSQAFNLAAAELG